ncbi:MAG: kelch repeat-containing protein [Planctomycetes bacterium]|nr:kelch repeat-containing protein [Planctomycetota bacterium]
MEYAKRYIVPSALFCLALSAGSSRAAEAAAPETNRWTLADDEKAGAREQHLLVYSNALQKAVVLAGGAPYVMSFDPSSRAWETLTDAKPDLGKAQPEAAACDSGGKNVYLLAGGRVFRFDVTAKTWAAQGEPMNGIALMAPTMAFDPVNNGLVVLGSERELDRVGWMGGAFLNLADGTWQPMAFGDEAARKAHDERRAVWTALDELSGRTRHAWYRDAKGEGTEGERNSLTERCAALNAMPGTVGFSKQVDGVSELVGQKKLFEALKAARALQRAFEEAMEAASPVPPARRHSPAVCDPVRKSIVLFGGDHEDYTTNDTWVLDLAKRTWRRANPKLAPSPRAGHGLVWLPKCGKIALWDGFRHNSSTDYRGFQATLLPQRECWLYDPAADSWSLCASWPNGEKGLPFRKGARNMGFFGYASQPFPMALAADTEDRLVFVGGGSKKQGKDVLNATWTLAVDATKTLGEAAVRQGAAPNDRAERTGPYPASYCEVPDAGAPAGLEALPANTWTLLPAPPRNPHSGRWGCDFGTATWNPNGDEILHWGGGHCRTSASVVGHRSMASNRMVIGYDLDEPYADNGGGPWPHSLLGRPWVGTHGYKAYGYDPKNKVLVLMRFGVGSVSRLYDPVSMRWLADGPKQPFDGHDYTAQVIPTPYGAVAWAGTREYMGREGRGLWLLAHEKEWSWKEIAKPGSAPACRVDCSCSCYDAKRERILLMPGGEDGGAVYACAVKGGAFEKLTPENPKFGQVGFREAVYIEHCDWVLLAQNVAHGGKPHHAVYDCAKNRWMLFDAGPLAAKMSDRGIGLMYDARRKLVYAMDAGGNTYALRIEPAGAQVVDKP